MKKLRILYRGPLESCNYDCNYCPFAKTKNTRAELLTDKNCLFRFVEWVREQPYQISILFTPWGEALIRGYYQEAIIELSNMPNVEKVVIQTNLSSKLNWLQKCNKEKVALWTTYHPTEISIQKFVDKCEQLKVLEVAFSVGIVGLIENFNCITELKKALPSGVYLWVNAYKRIPNYYTKEQLVFLKAIDPLFSINNSIYESKNKACFAGESSIAIDGEGRVTKCHFDSEVIGNIYQQTLKQILAPSICKVKNCRCYIGYINLKELKLENTYGNKILERIHIKEL